LQWGEWNTDEHGWDGWSRKGVGNVADTADRAESKLIHEETTREIIGAAMEVHRTLGVGFLEKVYENSLVFELRARGIAAEPQKPISVSYKGRAVGEYFADIVAADRVILELKSVATLTEAHEAQMLNYLRATGLRVGLLLNFGAPRLEWKRLVA
jgi:GxxExxY protein